MGFSSECTQKRFLSDGVELLRAIVIVPTAEDGEGMQALFSFCDELKARSFAFAEDLLLPSLSEAYGRLSPHDQKFCVPKHVYRVEIAAETVTDGECGECIRMTLSVSLKKRGGTEFEVCETKLWAKCGKKGEFIMIRPRRNAKKRQKSSKNT